MKYLSNNMLLFVPEPKALPLKERLAKLKLILKLIPKLLPTLRGDVNLSKPTKISYKYNRQKFFETQISGGGDTIGRQLSLKGGCLGY